MMRRWVAQTLERDCAPPPSSPPPHWISASPPSQTEFFIAEISLLFVSLATFSFFFFSAPRCLKAQNLNGLTMSTAFSANFRNSPQKSCGENQRNHQASCCFDAITEQGQERKKTMKDASVLEGYEHVIQNRSLITTSIREMEQCLEDGDCFGLQNSFCCCFLYNSYFAVNDT